VFKGNGRVSEDKNGDHEEVHTSEIEFRVVNVGEFR
jgi:hypothetical protein